MNTYCHSCGMPLSEETRGSDVYCRYCIDENGTLYPKEVVRKGIAEFLAGWAPSNDGVDFEARAEKYMASMPAWAE